MSSDLLTAAREWVGKPAREPWTAENPVNLPAIKRWTAAMGDRNPAYTGETDPVAPAAMLDVWTMAPYKPGGRAPEDGFAVLRLFDEAGYSGVVATDVEQKYLRTLRPGDRVSASVIVDDVSEEKRTGLGVGHFVTLRYKFADQEGREVGRMTFRVLKFKPPLAQPKPAEQSSEGETSFPHPRPAITHDNAHFWEGVQDRHLLIQQCSACEKLRHPPAPSCSHCGSLEWTTIEASGLGTVHSYVVMHEPKLPAFDYPLLVLLVDLEEGVRIVSFSDSIAPDDVRIGQPVRADFTEIEDGFLLPVFRSS